MNQIMKAFKIILIWLIRLLIRLFIRLFGINFCRQTVVVWQFIKYCILKLYRICNSFTFQAMQIIKETIKDSLHFLNIIFKFYKIYNFFMFIIYTIFVNPIDSFSSIIVYLSEVDVSEKASDNKKDTEEMDDNDSFRNKMFIGGCVVTGIVAAILAYLIASYFWKYGGPWGGGGGNESVPPVTPTVVEPIEVIRMPLTMDEMLNNDAFLSFLNIESKETLLDACRYNSLDEAGQLFICDSLRSDYAKFSNFKSLLDADYGDYVDVVNASNSNASNASSSTEENFRVINDDSGSVASVASETSEDLNKIIAQNAVYYIDDLESVPEEFINTFFNQPSED